MKKILVALLCVSFFVCVSSVALASQLPDTNHDVWLIEYINGNYIAYNGDYVSNSNYLKNLDGTPVYCYLYTDGAWVKYHQEFSSGVYVQSNLVFDSRGELATDDYYSIFPKPFECDGSACSVVDNDFNGVCDTCGGVLNFSLRATDELKEYALTQIKVLRGSLTGYDYWLITTENNNPTGYKYRVFVSNEPFTYDMPNDGLFSLGTVYTTTVTQMDSGQYGGTGWQTKEPLTYLVHGLSVDSSHEIDDFFPRPLSQEVLEVVQGVLPTLGMKMREQMDFLLPCGIGCLALLVGLALLTRKFRRFLPR